MLLILFSAPALALLGGISASGGWNETITSFNLPGGAGSDLQDTYTSDLSATLITVDANLDLLGWTVTVSRSAGIWNPNLHLYIRRADGGSGCAVSGGSSYQELTISDNTLFSCPALLNNGGSNYPVQYQLRGMSVQIPPGTYSTTIIYTVTGGVL